MNVIIQYCVQVTQKRHVSHDTSAIFSVVGLIWPEPHIDLHLLPVRHHLGDERAEANRCAWKDVQLHLSTCRYPLPLTCVSVVNGNNKKPYFSMMRSMDPEAWKRGKHTSTYSCSPIVASKYKCIAGCSIAIYQISAQCIQLFPRCGKEMRTYARANICISTPSRTCVKRIASGSLYPHTKVQGNAPSRSRNMEKECARAHVQM